MQKCAEQLRFCRSRHWLQEQAIWLRLYSCDTRPGSMESILDRIVAKGYLIIFAIPEKQESIPLPMMSKIYGFLVRHPDKL